MPQKLIIRLIESGKGDTPDEAGNSFKLSWRDRRQDLTRVCNDAEEIVVLLPSVDILLTEVKLPKLSKSRLLKALPFALYDQLTEEPESLHFAMANVMKGSPLPVAIVSKERMHAWQNYLKATLQEAYFKVSAFLPDVLAIPLHDSSFQVLIDNHLALVRTSLYIGYAIEKNELYSLLSLLVKTSAQKPTAIDIYTQTTEFLSHEQTQSLGVSVNRVSSYDVLEILSKGVTYYPINLLQGNFRANQIKWSGEQLRKFAFGLITAWLLLMTVSQLITIGFLQGERNSIDKEKQLIYASVYPHEKPQAYPKTMMQKELSTLRASRSGSTFFRLLNLLGQSISPLALNLTLKEISYRNNQLVVELEAKDLTVMETLRQTLEGQGLKVILSNAQRNTTGLVDTRLTLEEMS